MDDKRIEVRLRNAAGNWIKESEAALPEVLESIADSLHNHVIVGEDQTGFSYWHRHEDHFLVHSHEVDEVFEQAMAGTATVFKWANGRETDILVRKD